MFSRSHNKSHGLANEQKKPGGDARLDILQEFGLINPSKSSRSGRRKDSERTSHASGAVRAFTGTIFPERSKLTPVLGSEWYEWSVSGIGHANCAVPLAAICHHGIALSKDKQGDTQG